MLTTCMYVPVEQGRVQLGKVSQEDYDEACKIVKDHGRDMCMLEACSKVLQSVSNGRTRIVYNKYPTEPMPSTLAFIKTDDQVSKNFKKWVGVKYTRISGDRDKEVFYEIKIPVGYSELVKSDIDNDEKWGLCKRLK